MSIISEVADKGKTLVQGLAHTVSRIPQPKTTVSYPDEPVVLSARFRGEHFLDVDENGKERCVACFLCSAICPADAIYHGHNFEMASYTREGLIKDKEHLLRNRIRERELHVKIRT